MTEKASGGSRTLTVKRKKKGEGIKSVIRKKRNPCTMEEEESTYSKGIEIHLNGVIYRGGKVFSQNRRNTESQNRALRHNVNAGSF